MSTSKGSVLRNRPQKYQNRTAFKNDLHDKTVKTKFINSINPSGVCARCKDILEWKIKYKKYKPLTAPKKCVRCGEKNVKHAYHIMCSQCSRNEEVCAKCGQKVEIVTQKVSNTPAEEAEFQNILKTLPERKRRTLLRCTKKQNESTKKADKNTDDDSNSVDQDSKEVLAEKINKLKIESLKNSKDDREIDFSSDLDECSIDSDFTDYDDES